MKNKTSIIVLLFCFQSFAQISVNSSDFVAGADTTLISIVTDYQNIDYQSTGANHSWDFSWVSIDSQRIDTFSNVSNAGLIYQFTYNNFLNPNYQASYFQKATNNVIPASGALPVTIENPITFRKVSTAKLENVGIGIELNGIDVPIQADTIDTEYEFPMTYQDNWQSDSYLFFDINPAFNAMFKRHQTRISAVDGYGTITTTFGTFDCIRVKSNLNYIDSIFFDLLGTGGSWIGLPTQSETQYRWIAKQQKVPVFSVDVTNALAGPQITKVEFKDKFGVANIQNTDLISSIKAFPNPVRGNLFITNLSEYDHIEITNMNGQLIYSEAVLNENQKVVDCSQWEKGVYILKLNSSEKNITKKIIVA